MSARKPRKQQPLLTTRAAVIPLLACIVGALFGVLTMLGGGPDPAATLAGLTAAGTSAAGLNVLIGD